MTVIAPKRSHAQLMRSLKLANETRVYMAERKRALTAGTVTLGELLDDPGCGSMHVAAALQAIPLFGRQKADRVLRRAGVIPSKRVGTLTGRQRSAVIAEVGCYPAGRRAL